MSLTINGYRIAKNEIENLHHTRGILTVKPYIPSVFVKPQYVTRYPVFKEDEDYLYLPKHYGIQTFGTFKSSTRDVDKTDVSHWKFSGTIRDSQKPVVDSYLCPEPHDGIISLQTGGGKTVCALYIASLLQLPTVVLVHNTFLRDQWNDRIKSFLPNARIGTIQGQIIDIENKDIVVAMLQSVSMKEYSANLFKNFGLLIVDECHHIASESFCQAIPKLTCKYMLGLSATPERKDRLMHVIYNSSGVMFTSLMINKVAEYNPRNKLLITLIEDIFEDDTRQILVLSDRVEHTKVLYSMLSPEIQTTACILGREVKADKRAEYCATKRILIATYSMCKEGFDVATLNTLLIATPRPDVDQIVGRILRVEKKGRQVDPLIIDVVDPAFRRQFQERLSLYKKRNYDVQKMKLL